MKLGFGYFQYSKFFLNISILWDYILINYKLLFIFPNSLNLYISDLQATKILIRSMLCFVLLNLLCNHFVLVSKPKINLNFYKDNEITRIDSTYNFIKFYEYFFGNYDTHLHLQN